MDNVTPLQSPATSEEDQASSKSKSSIKFPYADLKESEKVARKVFEKGGHCVPEQLAAWLGHETANSGAFRNKVSAARMFGLIESKRNQISLTDRGKQIVADHTATQARVEAFLGVPLYRRLYDSHKDGQLPPDDGLQREMKHLGVTSTQLANARQTFQRSAQHAGFFSVGRNRLVLPASTQAGGATPVEGEKSPQDGHEKPPPPRDPEPTYPKVVEGALEEAPWGATWQEDEFREWIDLFERAARVHFKLPRKREVSG